MHYSIKIRFVMLALIASVSMNVLAIGYQNHMLDTTGNTMGIQSTDIAIAKEKYCSGVLAGIQVQIGCKSCKLLSAIDYLRFTGNKPSMDAISKMCLKKDAEFFGFVKKNELRKNDAGEYKPCDEWFAYFTTKETTERDWKDWED